MKHFIRSVLAALFLVAPAQAQEQPRPAASDDDEGGRIVGGTPAREGSAPWQIELYTTKGYSDEEIAADKQLRDDDPSKKFLYLKQPWEINHRCGGALIAPGWVLTAAHCVKPESEPVKTRRIRLGTQNLVEGGAEYAIDSIVVHSDYTPETKKHDIALIRLGAGPDVPAHVRPIRVLGEKPDDRPLTAREIVSVTGWGLTGARNSGRGALARDGTVNRASPVLMQVNLTVFEEAQCAAVPDYNGFLGKGTICAGSTTPGRDSCSGDSGGPLTRAEGRERVLVGLVSWGKGCGLAGVPGIYTDVTSYREWISAAMTSAKSGQRTLWPDSASAALPPAVR